MFCVHHLSLHAIGKVLLEDQSEYEKLKSVGVMFQLQQPLEERESNKCVLHVDYHLTVYKVFLYLAIDKT